MNSVTHLSVDISTFSCQHAQRLHNSAVTSQIFSATADISTHVTVHHKISLSSANLTFWDMLSQKKT